VKNMASTILALVTGIMFVIPAYARADQRSDEVDKLFGRWNTFSTPGMNIAIFRDGKEVYAHSYGMANLEMSRPNDAKLVYPIGSISKQFVGYCVQLLASEGKLSLTDDLRRYIPEMHDFGEPITLEMLLAHTSGVRDNVNLLIAKGRRVDDVIQEQESFDIVTRQAGLNFRPGTRFRYSNGNYVLLARVVERVSGMPIAAFLQQRVFNPLGMKHTSGVSDPVGVTANRAYGYSGENPAVPQTSSDSTYGNTGILSTVGDLAIWSTQFYEPGSMASAVFAAMKKPGVLSDGIPITYASGLHVEDFHGLPYVEHTGEVPGVHTDLLVFPKQRLSIILLANTDTCDPARLAFKVAEIYLRDEFPAERKQPQSVPYPTHALLEQYSGTYEIMSGTSLIGPGRKVRIAVDGDALRYNDEKLPLLASSDHDFYSQESPLRISFLPVKSSPESWMTVLHDPSGTDFAGRRAEAISSPETTAAPLPLAAYAGLYYSADLDTVYTVLIHDQTLSLRTPRGEVPMVLHAGDIYDVRGNMLEGKASGMLVFSRNGSAASGFALTLSGARAANIRFTRMSSETGR
jgi:CubicO group peptidase (beta-lactamase class C family)